MSKRYGLYSRGENHFHHKLTDADVMEIRKAYHDGEKQQDIATRYGVAQGLISKIVNGQAWTHLPVYWEEKDG